eukprot:1375967-Amphidinium_carterae.1
MSAYGFAWGCAGGALMQVVAAGALMVLECDHDDATCSEFDRLFGLCVCIALVGVWWSGWSLLSFWALRTRPGPPFPDNVPALLVGWQRAWATLKAICKLHQTRLYVLGYFLWSDALSTTQNVVALLLDEEEQNDSVKVLTLVTASMAATVGICLVLKVQQATGVSNKVVLLAEMAALAAVCVVGFFTEFEGIFFWLCGGTLALIMGSIQAYSRSLYAQLSPVGMESAMFSFYAISDKGSSLLGATVIAGVHTSTGSYRGALWYCFLAFAVSIGILAMVNVPLGQKQAGRSAPSIRKSFETEPPEVLGRDSS